MCVWDFSQIVPPRSSYLPKCRNQPRACLSATSNKLLFVCFCPLTNHSSHISLQPSSASPQISLSSPINSLHSAPFFFCFFAALLPNSVASHSSHWLCSPGPAMTVSFTRVSPVSSFSLPQPHEPGARPLAQPQHRPTEERHDCVKISQRSPRYIPGETSLHSAVKTAAYYILFIELSCICVSRLVRITWLSGLI